MINTDTDLKTFLSAMSYFEVDKTGQPPPLFENVLLVGIALHLSKNSPKWWKIIAIYKISQNKSNATARISKEQVFVSRVVVKKNWKRWNPWFLIKHLQFETLISFYFGEFWSPERSSGMDYSRERERGRKIFLSQLFFLIVSFFHYFALLLIDLFSVLRSWSGFLTAVVRASRYLFNETGVHQR